jgi:putative DNA primase/helicase
VDGEIIARLAALPSIEYDRRRKEEAETLGVRAGTLDKLVASARKTDEDDGGIEDVDPWPEPVEYEPLRHVTLGRLNPLDEKERNA